MKKRVLLRILTVVLVCTMLLGLVGFAPMVETLSGSQQTIAAVDGSTGDIKDTPDAGSTDKDTGDTGDAGEKEPEPDPDPEPEPDPGKCIVTIGQPDGGTITCAELPESGQVKAGTELTFTVGEDETAVSSTFRKAAVNGKVVEDVKGGKFTVVVEENITVTAEFFGIQSVTVSDADKWTRSKTVTVKTIGSVDSMTYQTTDGEAVPFDRSFEVKDEIGEKPVKYTITVNGGGQTVEKPFSVSKIDSKAPKAKYTFKNKGNKKIIGTVTVTDETQISAPVTFKYTGWIADKEAPVSSGVLNCTKRNTYEFTAPRYTNDGKEIRYTVSGQDEAGNVAIFNGNAGIVCDVLDGVTDSACAWVGGKSKIRVILAGIPENNLNVEATYDGQASKEPLFKNDKTLKDYVQPSGEIEIPISALNIEPYTLTTYRFSCEDSEAEVTVKYDPDAPVLNPEPTYVFTNTSAESRILHFISFGLLFNKQIEFAFDAKDIYRISGSDELQASGIAAVQYSTDDDKSKDSWRDMECERKDGLFHYTCSFDGKFTGSIYVRAIDNVGNVTSPAEVKFDGKSIIISNEGTTVSDDGVLSVYTTTDRNDTEMPYAGDWANNVTFTAITQQDENISSVCAVYVKDGKEHAIEMTKADDGSGAYYGVLNNEVYAGPVTITAYKKAEVTDAEANASATDNPVASVDISVKVQNNIDLGESVKIKSDQKTVELNSDEPIWWFNSNDNILNEANIDELTSLAPYAVYWKLERATVNDPYKFVQIDYGVYGNMTEKKYKELYESFEGSGFQKEYQCTSEPALDLMSQISETGIYRLSVRPVDEARNIAENWSDYTFKYDATAPMITAEFVDKKQPSANGKYYNIQRTVTISVTDEGFTGTEDLTNAEKITCKSGADALREEAWTWTTDHWECRYSYGVASGDARDGDDYELTVSVTDNAGNTSRTDKQGLYYINGSETAEPEASHYTGAGQANNQFTIDQTKPVVSVVFDNNSARNEKYFSAGRTATITVTEHNFKPELSVSMTAENATAGADAKEGWTQNGDVWTKTVTFDPQDAVCKFSITVTDLAGNECPDEDVNYGSSAAPREFVIDQVNPALEITGTNATPYADACAPGFTAHDTNMSTEYTMTLTRTVRASRNANVSDRFLTRDSVTVTGTDINAVFNTITEEAENDGIYILDVTVMDMAGNSTQTTSTFTVNRHGSFYIFNEALADVVNAKYVQKADGSYQVTEYNASPLVGDSVKIEIYRDGQLVTTLTPTVGAGVIGASGLYEYTYDLPAEHFAQNGRYKVALSSLDEAKNESDNTKLDDALLEFTVDSVAPEITMIKGLEKGIVNAKELTFSAAVMDTYGIASVQILVDGKVVKEYVTQEAYDALKAGGQALDHEYAVLTNTLDVGVECKLLESSSRQHVVIAVTDMAGNVTQTDSKDFAPSYDFHENVLVSTNFWARYIHNVWALVVTGVVILALAGGIWYVTAKKKKEHTAA